jgi:hypothetical protein
MDHVTFNSLSPIQQPFWLFLRHATRARLSVLFILFNLQQNTLSIVHKRLQTTRKRHTPYI